jgi:hypothetical protein
VAGSHFSPVEAGVILIGHARSHWQPLYPMRRECRIRLSGDAMGNGTLTPTNDQPLRVVDARLPRHGGADTALAGGVATLLLTGRRVAVGTFIAKNANDLLRQQMIHDVLF